MRPNFLDRYSRLDSPVHRVPAGVKVLAALSIVIATALVPIRFPGFFLAVVGLLLLVAGVSRIPPAFVLRRLALLEPFVLGIGLLMLLEPGGWWHFLVFALRSTVCLLTMTLLSNTTPFSEVLGVLKAARCPALLVTLLALTYRYLFVLVDETERMQRARLSRTFTRSRSRTWKRTGSLAGQLFVRTSERADRVFAAMCARGWK
jgi:cobalt ECF transporter T component CbiQ